MKSDNLNFCHYASSTVLSFCCQLFFDFAHRQSSCYLNGRSRKVFGWLMLPYSCHSNTHTHYILFDTMHQKHFASASFFLSVSFVLSAYDSQLAHRNNVLAISMSLNCTDTLRTDSIRSHFI